MEDIAEPDRMLPRVVDIRAARDPDRVFAYLPKGASIEDGFQPLTYGALARAIDAVAWWLDETFGKAPQGIFPTLPYIGPNDIRYSLLVFAAVKTGRTLLVPLLYNTPEAQTRLLSQCQAEVVIASAGYEKFFDPARESMKDLRLVNLPDAEVFLGSETVPSYPYEKTVSEGQNDPLTVIQTSGTTGNPKPLHYSCRYVASTAARVMESNRSGPDQKFAFETLMQKCTSPSFLPLSWGVGLWQVSIWPVILENVPILLPTSVPQPMKAELIHILNRHIPKLDRIGAIFVPDVLKEMARKSEYLEGLRIYQWVGYAGAPLDGHAGDLILEQGIRVESILGSTDVGAYPTLLNDPKDWKLSRFKEFSGFHLQEFGQDSYELCVSRQRDDERPCFILEPDCDVYHTKDIWTRIPGREGFWKMSGRVDDFVKLSTMTKFNAVEIERILERHPGIEKTIVAGDARSRPFVLVEPKAALRESSSNDDSTLIRQIWTQFEEANQHIYRDARLTDGLVLITRPDVPIKRTVKGTANRRSTLALYAEEIEAMYKKA